MKEVEKAISNLNLGRARYPASLCAELFQPNAMGSDLKSSLCEMLNLIKEQGHIPEFMKVATITAIPKPGP